VCPRQDENHPEPDAAFHPFTSAAPGGVPTESWTSGTESRSQPSPTLGKTAARQGDRPSASAEGVETV